MPDNLRIIVDAAPTMAQLVAKYNLSSREVKQIGTSAINRSLTSIRSRVVKRLAGEINMLQRDIRDSVTINKANYDKLTGAVTVSKKPVPLIDFIGTVQNKVGVSVLVRKSEGRQMLKGAFIQTMPTGHVGVFERLNHLATKGPNAGIGGLTTWDGRLYRKAWRFAIGERFGLTLTGYLTNAPAVVAEETAAASEIFQKNLMSQLSRRLAARP